MIIETQKNWKVGSKSNWEGVIFVIIVFATAINIIVLSTKLFFSHKSANSSRSNTAAVEKINNSSSTEKINNKPVNTPKLEKKQTPKTTSNEILDQINNYQARYFSIIKRNDVFLQTNASDKYEKDIGDLNILYNEVKSKIKKNSDYYKKYLAIEEEFREYNSETESETNELALNYYMAIDKLLNEVYQVVKTKLEENDFVALRATQRKWLKDNEEYNNISDYQLDARKFRTLLLMMYL